MPFLDFTEKLNVRKNSGRRNPSPDYQKAENP